MDKIFESIKKPLTVESKKVLTGPFAKLDEFNHNGRRYPGKVYRPAYESIAPKIPARRLLGELDHPMSYDEVRLTNVSHVITECQILDNGDVTGKVELLDTPAGLVAQALVEAGVPLGISSRGLGATRKVNEGVEVTQLKLITFDLVAEPSFGNAILLSESAFQGLDESFTRIESNLPLNESVETESVRNLIAKLRESVQVEGPTREEEELALFEGLMNTDDNSSLRESLEIKQDQVQHLEGLVEAREEELRIQGKLVQDMQRIIENLKLAGTTKTPAEFSQLVESLGQLTLSDVEKEERISSLNENMQSLQELYNQTVEQLTAATSNSEALNEEVVTLRKKLAIESRGLSWKKHSSLLEGLTTEREISDKLDSISNLSNVSRTFASERVVKSLTESSSLSGHSSRLSSIISRV